MTAGTYPSPPSQTGTRSAAINENEFAQTAQSLIRPYSPPPATNSANLVTPNVMEKLSKQKVWQAAACLACVGVLWIRLDDFGASEFSGGRITGKLFTMADLGSLLFLVALLLTIFFPRVAAVVALAATLLCLPFYLYILMPGPYRQIFKGEYSVPLQSSKDHLFGTTGPLSEYLAS